jgi:hypothetical protein
MPAASASTDSVCMVGAEGDDPDGLVGEEVDGQPLLGRAPAQVEQRAVAPDEVEALVGPHPREGRLAPGVQHDPGVAGQVARFGEVGDPLVPELVDCAPVDDQLLAPVQLADGEPLYSRRRARRSTPSA